MKSISLLTIALALVLPLASLRAADAKPLRVLLITGGCCHDYARQKDILKKGIEARANIQITQVHTDDKSTKPPLAILGDADYAKGYDAVIHGECAADVKDPAVIAGVLAPHRAGIPGVNLHCAMHSYRVGNPGTKATNGTERAAWFDYLGLQSSGHGPQEPLELNMLGATHPVTRGMTNWITIREELYNNIQVLPTATPLINGKQTIKQKDGSTKDVEAFVAWVNQYDKTRVFSTSVGHNNDTVNDTRYLDLVTRGLLWACGKLGSDGRPAAGYGPAAN